MYIARIYRYDCMSRRYIRVAAVARTITIIIWYSLLLYCDYKIYHLGQWFLYFPTHRVPRQTKKREWSKGPLQPREGYTGGGFKCFLTTRDVSFELFRSFIPTRKLHCPLRSENASRPTRHIPGCRRVQRLVVYLHDMYIIYILSHVYTYI